MPDQVKERLPESPISPSSGRFFIQHFANFPCQAVLRVGLSQQQGYMEIYLGGAWPILTAGSVLAYRW
jgi:hypothetical protein